MKHEKKHEKKNMLLPWIIQGSQSWDQWVCQIVSLTQGDTFSGGKKV